MARLGADRRAVFVWTYRDRFRPRAALLSLGLCALSGRLLPLLVRPLGMALLLPAGVALVIALGFAAHVVACATVRRLTLRPDAVRVERILAGFPLASRVVPFERVAAIIVTARGPFCSVQVRRDDRRAGAVLPFEDPVVAAWLKSVIENAVHAAARAGTFLPAGGGTVTAPIVYADGYALRWPGHVFPVEKYRHVARALREAGLADDFHVPAPATIEQVLTCHESGYIAKLEAIADGREPWILGSSAPWTGPCSTRSSCRRAAPSSPAASRSPRATAANIGGGFHHAYPDHGEGFCLLNDVMVAARALLDGGLAKSVLVVDLDVHQGNGTAVMAQGEERIYTLSLHQENNYPFKEDSDLDVGLRDRCEDGEYLSALDWALKAIDDRFDPGFVLYLAGADVYEEDRLGGLSISMDGLRERDGMVFDYAERHGVPVAALLAGGYAKKDTDVETIHVAMIRELLARWRGRRGQSKL